MNGDDGRTGGGPAQGDDAPDRTSPEASGLDPSLRLLGGDELAALRARALESDDLDARVLRLQADLDNFRRRELRERRQAADEEVERVLGPVLNALDSFGRAVAAAATSRDVDALLDGVRIALREVERGLADAGVERIEAVGKPLDPALHRAIAQEATAEVAPMTVLEEFAAGWRRGDRVLRAAVVKVAAAPTAADSGDSSPEGDGE